MSSPEPVKLFAERMPLQMQIQNMTRLREESPARAREIFMIGEQLTSYAANGELRALRKKVFEIEDETGIFPYFGSKMFKESLANGHLLVSLFIIENGYPFKNKSYPSAMHEVLDAESFPDYLGAGVVSFLAQQGCDVNRQIGGTWLTPLHIAVRRNLVQTVATLISLGADVNAVGKNDVMPLNIAQQQQVDDEKSQRALLITRMLEQNGAKATVRELLRGSNAAEESAATAAGSAFSFSTSGGVPFTTNSMVSVKGTAGIPNPTRTALSAAPAASMAPTMVSAAGGGGGLLRFSGGGPSPVAPTGGHGTIFTKLSSSSYKMNEAMATTEPSSDAAPNSMRSLVYSKSDDGGLMFSTSS